MQAKVVVPKLIHWGATKSLPSTTTTVYMSDKLSLYRAQKSKIAIFPHIYLGIVCFPGLT